VPDTRALFSLNEACILAGMLGYFIVLCLDPPYADFSVVKIGRKGQMWITFVKIWCDYMYRDCVDHVIAYL
jgi:hypothetical protein